MPFPQLGLAFVSLPRACHRVNVRPGINAFLFCHLRSPQVPVVVAYLMGTSFFSSALRCATASFKSSHCNDRWGHWTAPLSSPVCADLCAPTERRQQQVCLSPGHQKNAATRGALIYARQCLTTKIAFSTESTLEFNAGFAWQCSRPQDDCDEIQHPLTQQGSHLLQAHC